VPEVPREALDQMLAHPWPGNVRELKNTVERLVITSHKGVDGRYLRVNKAYCALMEKKPEQLSGSTFNDIVNDAAAHQHRLVDSELLANPGTRTYELRQRVGGGRWIDTLVSKATVSDKDKARPCSTPGQLRLRGPRCA
jgi:DNA-binding NtrC family response regulator